MDYIEILKETGALLEGHFVLTSGRHSGQFVQCAQVLKFPEHTETLCRALAQQFSDKGVTTVIGPAVGGIIVAYEIARHLRAQAIFAEKQEGKLILGRGFFLAEGEKVLVVEDVTTTGGSVKKVVDIARRHGAEPVGIGILVDRSGGTIKYDLPFKSLITLKMESFPPGECPLCRKGVALTDPDLRKPKNI